MKKNRRNQTDLLQQLGTLAFASRLRRLSESLLRDVSLIYQAEKLNFEARWFPVFYLLWRQSPLAVTAIAQRLHLTHPAVNQVAGAMTKAGLLLSARDQNDDRRRLLSLSPEGRKLARKLQPIWLDIQQVTAEVVDASGPAVLETIARIEASLDERSMYERVLARFKNRQLEAVEIIDYQPRLRNHFRNLNLEWITKYFSVEPADKIILDDPQGQVIDKGGIILFARFDRKIAGTVALIKHDSKTFELAKMAVSESARGHQVGKKLTLAAIERTVELGANKMILFTNPNLIAANSLYRKLGFLPSKTVPHDAIPYKRPTVALELKIGKTPHHKQQRKQI